MTTKKNDDDDDRRKKRRGPGRDVDARSTGRTWFRVHIPFLTRYAHLPGLPLATWMRLAGACATRLSAGVLEGAARWSTREWYTIAASERSEVDECVARGLARWDGDDLRLSDYDAGGDVEYSRQRAAAEKARAAKRPKAGKDQPLKSAVDLSAKDQPLKSAVSVNPDIDVDGDVEEKRDRKEPSTKAPGEATASPPARSDSRSLSLQEGTDRRAAGFARRRAVTALERGWRAAHAAAGRPTPASWGPKEAGQGWHLLGKIPAEHGAEPCDRVEEASRRFGNALRHLTAGSPFWRARGALTVGDVLARLDELGEPPRAAPGAPSAAMGGGYVV